MQRTRKRYFDENIPDDVQAVLDVSAIMGIAEFRVFDIAYREWHGEDADEATIERYFTPYMFHDVVPPWVRHFCNRVLELDRLGRLDPTFFGVLRRPASKDQVNKGRLYALCLVTTMVVLFLLAELGATQFCLFPPCY